MDERIVNTVLTELTAKSELKSLSEPDKIKTIVHSLVVDVQKVVDEMAALCILCNECPQIKEKYTTLVYKLTYLKRYCENKV